MPPAVSKPILLTDPGFLWGAPLATAVPTNTITAGKFSDAVAAAWIPFGATESGSTFNYSTSVEAIRVAELLDPVAFATTERGGSLAFALKSYTLSNFKRALNGGMAAVVPTGTAGQELSVVEPPEPGAEVRIMLLWESTDSTLRLLLRQCLQGGDMSTTFGPAPASASIPCTFNMEIPTVGKPFSLYGAGLTRV